VSAARRTVGAPTYDGGVSALAITAGQLRPGKGRDDGSARRVARRRLRGNRRHRAHPHPGACPARTPCARSRPPRRRSRKAPRPSPLTPSDPRTSQRLPAARCSRSEAAIWLRPAFSTRFEQHLGHGLDQCPLGLPDSREALTITESQHGAQPSRCSAEGVHVRPRCMTDFEPIRAVPRARTASTSLVRAALMTDARLVSSRSAASFAGQPSTSVCRVPAHFRRSRDGRERSQVDANLETEDCDDALRIGRCPNHADTYCRASAIACSSVNPTPARCSTSYAAPRRSRAPDIKRS